MNFFRFVILLAAFCLLLEASTIGQETALKQDWSKLDFATAERLISGSSGEAHLPSLAQTLRHASPQIQLMAAKKMSGLTSERALNTFVTVFDEQPTFKTGGAETHLIHRQFVKQLIVNMAVALKQSDQDGDDQWEKAVLEEARRSIGGALFNKEQEVPAAPNGEVSTPPLPSVSLLPTMNKAPVPTSTTLVPSAGATSSTPWSMILILIVAASALLWVLLKRRS